MAEQFKIGDHVRWNSEAGHVSGRIIKIHTRDTEYKGHPGVSRRAGADDHQVVAIRRLRIAPSGGVHVVQPLSLMRVLRAC